MSVRRHKDWGWLTLAGLILISIGICLIAAGYADTVIGWIDWMQGDK